IDGADAAINGFARFSDAVPGGTDIYYVVESTDTDKNEWEVGVGQYAAGAISRLASRVIAGSAGAGALVNFTAGEKVVYIAALSRTLDGQVKNDLLTDFVPDATNDETEGFERGSIVFGGGTFWICSDPAENTAVWSM